jgi:hypothetical protein
MKRTIAWFGKNYVWISLAVILVLAVFVRTYHFEEWLYFKMDQSRDAILMNTVFDQGPGYLPLLGPRVGAVELEHGFLRLGPAFYYFQYLAMVLFRSAEPPVLAYPDLFFSIAVIPLLYLFLRLYFAKRNALLVTAMYAFSFLIIEYSRFSWNPNALQFFIIASFYGLLRFLNEARPIPRRWWLALWVSGITIGSQLHFFGFFSLLGISGLLVLFHLRVWDKERLLALFRKESLKAFAGFLGIGLAIFLALYSPVIVSDVMEGGQNTMNFFEALGSKADKKPMQEKLVKAVEENLNYYCLLTTSGCVSGDIGKNAIPVVASGLILLGGLILAVRKLRKTEYPRRRDFLALLLIWFSVFAILTIPVAFQLRPRFYIVVFALPFIFLGLLYEYLEERFGKKAIAASLLLTAAVLVVNMRGTLLWFGEQARAQMEVTDVKRTLILKNKDGVTLGQLRRVTDWMYARHAPGKTLYYYVKPEHERPIHFLLSDKRNIDLRFTTMKMNGDPEAQFFAVTPAKNGLAPVTKKYGPDIDVIDSAQFGELMVFEIDFPKRVVSPEFKLKESGGGDDRLYFKDVIPSIND